MADWYVPSGVPGFHAAGTSSDIRGELAAIKAGLSDKLPILAGRALRPVFVDETGTMLESITIADALALFGLDIGVNTAVCTGSANAYVATITGITAYTNLQRLTLQIPVGNTTTSTFNINGLGVKYGCRLDGSALESGDLATGGIYDFCYNSTFGKLVLMTMMPSSIQSSTPTFTSLTTSGNITTGGTLTTTGAITTPIVKTGLVSVSISAGNLTLDLSAGSAFDLASMASNATVTFTNFDITKQVTFSLRVVTTGAYNFTAITMTGVTIHYDENMVGPGVLKASGETLLGFLFTGTDLIVINSYLLLY